MMACCRYIHVKTTLYATRDAQRTIGHQILRSRYCGRPATVFLSAAGRPAVNRTRQQQLLFLTRLRPTDRHKKPNLFGKRRGPGRELRSRSNAIIFYFLSDIIVLSSLLYTYNIHYYIYFYIRYESIPLSKLPLNPQKCQWCFFFFIIIILFFFLSPVSAQ